MTNITLTQNLANFYYDTTDIDEAYLSIADNLKELEDYGVNLNRASHYKALLGSYLDIMNQFKVSEKQAQRIKKSFEEYKYKDEQMALYCVV